MYRNAIVGAISIAALISVAQAANAQTVQKSLSPSSIPGVSPPTRVVARIIVTKPMYTVKPGDTLSGISGKLFGNKDDWPKLYGANEKVVGKDPNLIIPGEKLKPILGKPAYGHAAASVARARQVSSDYKAASSAQQTSYQQPNPAPQHSASTTYNGSGGMQQCIIARESGGNSQVMNSSGHYGLYQFSEQTWVAHGGNPGSFGNASVAEQNSVFQNTVAADGYSDWTPYDGC